MRTLQPFHTIPQTPFLTFGVVSAMISLAFLYVANLSVILPRCSYNHQWVVLLIPLCFINYVMSRVYFQYSLCFRGP
jgi:uncharacterized membrane protein